jgi:inner membrane protein
MDSLTHGLLGAAIAAIPLPRRLVMEDGSPVAQRAAIVAAVLAAELPDLDYLLPAADPVLHTLRAHRGLTHALIAAPAIALAAALLTKLIFRRARLSPLFARGLIAVPLAHLLPDLWTGWGTRLLLPFSEQRFALDWTMVVDPLFTLPLFAAACWALFRRASFRRSMAIGAAVSAVYLVFRIASAHLLTSSVRQAYPTATGIRVFPAPLATTRWRYVVELDGLYAAGSVGLGGTPDEEARVASFPTGPLPERLASIPTVREALNWARFPVVRSSLTSDSAHRIEIADLRYHLRGAPTLTFVVLVAAEGTVQSAHLERGGSVRELFQRWRQSERE